MTGFTEKQAGAKFCPMARITEVVSEVKYTPAYNRIVKEGLLQSAPCAASGCMMWKWDTSDFTEKDKEEGRATGRCGLAK